MASHQRLTWEGDLQAGPLITYLKIADHYMITGPTATWEGANVGDTKGADVGDTVGADVGDAEGAAWRPWRR